MTESEPVMCRHCGEEVDSAVTCPCLPIEPPAEDEPDEYADSDYLNDLAWDRRMDAEMEAS